MSEYPSTFTIDASASFPVDGRELHTNLGVGRDFSTWIRERIERFSFTENIDYRVITFSPDPGNQNARSAGRRSIEYSLTVQAAKMIAAIENTPTGREVLAHLVKVEEAWNEPEMVLVRAEQASRIIIGRLKERLARIEPDAAAARVIACAEGLKTLSEVGKINGTGPRRFIELLADRGILFRSRGCWVPYQRYIDAGYFTVRERAVGREGEEFLKSQTYITGKGELWLARQFFLIRKAPVDITRGAHDERLDD